MSSASFELERPFVMSCASSSSSNLRSPIHHSTSSTSSSPTASTPTSLSLCPFSIGQPSPSLRIIDTSTGSGSGSDTSTPLIRIVTSLSCDSPPSAVTTFTSAQSSTHSLSSSHSIPRARSLRRMSSTGTRLNFPHCSSTPSNACANALLASPLTGHRRPNPFGLQSTITNHPSETMVIGGECGLADGGTSCNGRPPSGKKWIAHHLSAVLQHSFSVSSLQPITSVPECSTHYSSRPQLSGISANAPLTPADQLRYRASSTSLSSFTESTTTDEDDEDEEAEAESSTSSNESFLQLSDSDPLSASLLHPSFSSTYRPQIATTPRQSPTCPLGYRNPSPKGATTRRTLLKLLDTWSFDANSLSPLQIRHALHVLLSSYLKYTPGFVAKLSELGVSQPEKGLATLVDNLEVAYDPRNAYHNFRHAVDVVQAVYTMLSHQGVVPPLNWVLRFEADEAGLQIWQRNPVGRVGRALDEVTVWALLLAAAGHDVGHPGLSNAFMVNARTPISHVFSDGSVLENFHRITFTRMLREHGFEKLVDGHPGFRRVVAGSVLATDMGRHFPIVEELKALGTRWLNEPDDETTPFATLDEKVTITAGLIKCGDISNSSRPHHISLTWSSCLLTEWSRQAALENDLQLPVSVVTLDPAEKRAQAKSQIGFTTLFVLPLFSVMEALSPVAFKPFANSCRLGLKTWQKVVEHIDALSQVAGINSSSAASVPYVPESTMTTLPMGLRPALEDMVSPTRKTARIPQVSFTTSTPVSNLPSFASTSILPSLASVLIPHPLLPRRSESTDERQAIITKPLAEPSDDQSPADDHLTPKPAQRGWWASSPSPPATPNTLGQASASVPAPSTTLAVEIPSVWDSSSTTSSDSPCSLSGKTLTQQDPTLSPEDIRIGGEDERKSLPSERVVRFSSSSRRTLTITVPEAGHDPSNAKASTRLHQLPSPENQKMNSAMDDSSFSSLGSPSSPSQSPYFTPGVSSASSVESSTDGSDLRVSPGPSVLHTALGHPSLPSGLGLRVGNRIHPAIIRPRDKGMSVDFGFDRRTLTRASLPVRKKSYSPYLVNEQVACAKGCGKVTAKCVKCGAASKTKMQRSQSLAKPSLFLSNQTRSTIDQSLDEETDEPVGLSIGEEERKRVKARLIEISHSVNPLLPTESDIHQDQLEPDASSWPPYPFRPS